jgi:tetratricopeptide (TPR) repeat protein
LSARLAYTRASRRLGKRSAQGHYLHGKDLYLADDYRLARLHLIESLLLDPGNPYARLILGHCQQKLGHLRRAARTYPRALHGFRDCHDQAATAEAAYEAACVHAQLERIGEALYWFKLSVELEPAYAKHARTDPRLRALTRARAFRDLLDGPLAVGGGLATP